MIRIMPYSACRGALFCIAFYCTVCLISAQKESPEMVAKWRSFMQSLSPELRKKFDALHAEADKMEPGSVQQRVKDFLTELSPAQKKQYKEIQQRGGGSGGGGRGGIGTEGEDAEGGGSGGSVGRGSAGRGGSEKAGGGRGGEEEEESGRGGSAGRGGSGRGRSGKGEEEAETGRGSTGRGGGSGMEAKLDEWIGRSDLSTTTRQALRKVKDIYMRPEMEASEKCEQIQRQLKTIGTGDKAKLNIPTKLLTMDCAEAGTKGPQNLVAGIGTGKYAAKSGDE